MTTEVTTAPIAPGFTNADSWELAQRVGKAFAASTLVPEVYRNNVANCIVALEMANRMGASPLLVMQNLYLVHGTPGWSAKFLIACFNTSGRFTSLRYEWSEKRDACRAWATEKATGERLVGPEVTIEMAKAEGWSGKSGSKWKTMPELMLTYRAAAFMIRTYAPELSMGLHTEDELREIGPVNGEKPSAGLEAVRAAIAAPAPQQQAETLDMETGEVPPPVPDEAQADAFSPPTKTYAQYVDAIQHATSTTTAELELDAARDLPQDQYNDLLAVYRKKWLPPSTKKSE